MENNLSGQLRKWVLVIFVLLSFPFLAAADEVQVNDPLESVNRGIFWFNDTVDVYFLEPVARGYDYLLPRPVKKSVGNFFENLGYPSYLISSLIQLKFHQATEHTVRFVVNTTAGIGGLFDVAKHVGFKHHHEDFGTALGYNGVPGGAYLVLPLLGPTNLRDGVGRLVDSFLNPVYYLPSTDIHDDTALAISSSLTALNVINTRAEMLEAIQSGKDASLDFYLFVRSAYQQRRQGLIYDGNPPGSEDEFEDDDFGDDSFEDEQP